MKHALRFFLTLALAVSAVLSMLHGEYQMGWIYIIALDVTMISWDVSEIKDLLFTSQEEDSDDEDNSIIQG